MKTATALAAAIAAFLIGLSFAGKPVEKTVTVPGETVTVTTEKVITDPADAVRIGELESQIADLTAELQKARQRQESTPIAACETLQATQAAVPSVVPYQRRGLFGRLRNR